MNSQQMLHLVTILCLVYVLLSTSTRGNPVDNNLQHAGRRELATENPGFISIDCGADEDYVDEETGIFYKSDTDFISTGKNQDTSPEYNIPNRQLKNLRIFPQGKRNCYTLKPEQGKNHSYLIRAFFMYGNYDGKNQIPKFDLYFGVNYWARVQLETASAWTVYDTIFFSLDDFIYVCLVNTGFGIPIISAVELRLLNNSIYLVEFGSLGSKRFDLGNPTKVSARYKDDAYDRIWDPYSVSDWVSINTTAEIDIWSSNNSNKVPVEVLKNAVQPKNNGGSLNYSLNYNHSARYFYVNFYFTEIAETAQGQRRREFTITLNGVNYGPFSLEYLKPLTVLSLKTPIPISKIIHFSIDSTLKSDLPPILNAFEILFIFQLPLSPTNPADVDSIIASKQAYKIKRDDWQGDPCVPRDFVWSGLTCSYVHSPPRIISLNLNSSNLTGEIASSISNLKALQSLDLSNNDLTGAIPEFLAQLSNLTILNLTGNKFTGLIPHSLIEKSENGTLLLSWERNPNLCKTKSCEDKKHSFLVLIIASIISIIVLFLLCIIAVVWRMRRHGETDAAESRKEPSLKSKNQFFTYTEIVSITNNLRMIIGEEGFGKVYLGKLQDGTQVAVKLLSQTSTQGYKEFKSEVQLLMIVYHRNLVSLIGYSDEKENKALVYEYMANGNLRQRLNADSSTNVLSWLDRLKIAVDAAHGLEYLHNGCRPPIIHRDLKTSNILLDENLLAKISDFGLSRVFASEKETHVKTCPAGTFGYVDPEFYTTGNLNKKSDVYSFGIILFELITGQPVVRKDGEYSAHILQWVGPMIESGYIRGIVDPRLLQGEFNTNSAWKAVEIAMSCALPTAIQRPDINHVLAELKECLAMEIASETPIIRTQNNITAFSNSLEMTFPSAR